MSQNYEKILVAVDDSSAAELGLKKAIVLAKQNMSHLVLVHVIDIRTYGLVERGDVKYRSNIAAKRRQMLNQYQAACYHEGVPSTSAELSFGNPVSVIAKEMVKKHQPNLIVLGISRRNGLEKWLKGDFQQRLSQQVPCDLLTIQVDKTS
ncbi:nucleotide-binding universal stress UspA family protein [Geomicrobium halophilum]|uniref:Nucleotide-binding universal stress UspA family protein n=1 Tax=Geomicrobium halophilum TaxID=549000 RepID=A0A841PRW8_9BACL|nr:universal stress protein [Geomicrobium halophilum]MBB6451539.1 nucleotide-binding universal stress UspA family protein [Geomicrobium halophilum]